MIKTRTMGRTGLHFSELCLGSINFGWKIDEASAHAILDAYHAAGGNFIQATNWSPDHMLPSAALSKSEEVVGRWWTKRGIPRQDLFLTTRIHVRRPVLGEGDFIKAMRDAVEGSMRRLRTSYLDMVILEWNDGLLPMEATIKGCHLAVREGAVRYIGAANFPLWRVAHTLAQARVENLSRMEALQADYSLMTRARFEPDAMELCQEQRLGFFASSPLAGGFLARGHDLESMRHSVRRNRLIERFGNIYGQLARAAVESVAERHGASPAQVALAWTLHNPTVTSAIIGVHSVAQLNELVRATSIVFTAADVYQLERATMCEEVRLTPDFVARA